MLASVIIASVACRKEGAPTSTIDQMQQDSSVLILKGDFNAGPYGNVTGIAKVYKRGNTYQLKVDTLNTWNGPNLKVLLSKEIQPINYIDLGSLQSTMGNQVYNINGAPDFSSYKYALIHCVDYNHLFGWAELRP